MRPRDQRRAPRGGEAAAEVLLVPRPRLRGRWLCRQVIIFFLSCNVEDYIVIHTCFVCSVLNVYSYNVITVLFLYRGADWCTRGRRCNTNNYPAGRDTKPPSMRYVFQCAFVCNLFPIFLMDVHLCWSNLLGDLPPHGPHYRLVRQRQADHSGRAACPVVPRNCSDEDSWISV